jgi:hypothetical protein
MHTSMLWLLVSVAVIFGAIVFYALHLGRNVKASMKILWTTFSFEASEPDGAIAKIPKNRTPKPMQ